LAGVAANLFASATNSLRLGTCDQEIAVVFAGSPACILLSTTSPILKTTSKAAAATSHLGMYETDLSALELSLELVIETSFELVIEISPDSFRQRTN
jgi:hypothetical protein